MHYKDICLADRLHPPRKERKLADFFAVTD